MRQAAWLILMAPVILGLSGCGTPKPIMYYQVQIPAGPASATHTYPIDMVVGRITGPNLLESSPIAYKNGQNAIGTYQYHRWTDTPVEMVQLKLIRLLRTSGEFRSVSRVGSHPGGDLMVRGRLYDFTEVDGDGISALVSMEFELYNRESARILWTHFYSQKEPVEGKKIPEVVQALDRNLERGLKEVVAGLDQYFAANPPGKREETSAALNEARTK